MTYHNVHPAHCWLYCNSGLKNILKCLLGHLCLWLKSKPWTSVVNQGKGSVSIQTQGKERQGELLSKHLQPEGCLAKPGEALEEAPTLTQIHWGHLFLIWYYKISSYSFFSILGDFGDCEQTEWLWDVARLVGEGKWWLWRHSCLQARRNSSWTWLWCMKQRGSTDRDLSL